ncbi:MAG: hypothetical protein ACYC6M_03575 [Terriglobales bacterium]
MLRGPVLRIALTQTAPLRRGAAVQGRLVEPVYQQDTLLWPTGTRIDGEVATVSSVTTAHRIWEAAQGVLSPSRTARVRFNTAVLPSGPVRFEAAASTGASEIIELQAAGAERPQPSTHPGSLPGRVRHAAMARVHRVRAALNDPQRWKRLQAAVSRTVAEKLPYRPQHLAAGSQYTVLVREAVASVAAPPPDSRLLAAAPAVGTVLRASLLNRLSSASNRPGDPVTAVLLQPVQLQGGLLPAGTRLEGKVVQAAPSRAFGHNGQLRFNFDQLELATGQQVMAPATVQGAAVDRASHLKLDPEGGATVATPPSRYWLPALAVAMAAQAAGDDESGAGRSGGLGLLGVATTLIARSHPVSLGLAVAGASFSLYRHLIAPGRDVVFPRGTELQVQMGRAKP